MASNDTLPALKNNPKYIFFTDFDGTITTRDSNDFMTDNLGYGGEKRRAGNLAVLENRMTFRDSFRDMMDSVKTPYNKCIEILLENIKLDPGFREFFQWTRENNMPIVILSGGMRPIIMALLEKLIGPDAAEMQIVSNNVEPREGMDINQEGGWQIHFHDESHFGHDKSLAIRPYSGLPEDNRPILFYAGDGVSDLSAAKETDLLFAKRGHDLTLYCVRESVPFIEFDDWSDILATVKDIVAGKTNVKEVALEGIQPFRHHGK